MAAQGLKGRALVGRSQVQLNVVSHRACHRKLQEKLRQQPKLTGPLLHVGKIDLELLYAFTGVQNIPAQAFHRRSQTNQQVKDTLVRHEFHSVFIKAPVDIAPVVLIAVVDQVVFVHIVDNPQCQLQGDILPVDRSVLLRVVNIGSVHRNTPAQEGQGFQRLGQPCVNAPGGWDDKHPLLCRRFQRSHILRRDVLFPVQQSPVKIKGY